MIGLEQYAFIPGVPHAHRDANAMYEFLVYTRGVPADRVRLLKEGDRAAIERAVEEAGRSVAPGGTVWVYFAGHGLAHPETKERLLLGDDVRSSTTSIADRGARVADLTRLAGAGGGTVQLIVDACYGGTGRDGAELLAGSRFAVPDFAMTTSRAVVEWSAAGPGQWSGPMPGARHGAFTYLAIGAMRGWADGELGTKADGVVTAEEAHAYVNRSLRRLALNHQASQLIGDRVDAVVLSTGVNEQGPTWKDAPAAAAPPAPAPTTKRRRQKSKPGDREVSPTGYALRFVPAGSYTIGCTAGQLECRQDVKPPVEVELNRGFWIGETEVTQGLYEQITGVNPSTFRTCGPSCPVETVSWYDAVAFANALSLREGLPLCYAIAGESVTLPNGVWCGGYRLPTEAEWEVAARAGTDTYFAGGDEVNEVAWFLDNSFNTTNPVCKLAPNRYGLCDLSGNVGEWVWDRWDHYPRGPVVDPTGAATGSDRLCRGGSWRSFTSGVSVSFRCGEGWRPGYVVDDLGFRLVRAGP